MDETMEVAEAPKPKPKKKKEKVGGAQYIGKGSYVYDVPARDLSVDEWQALSDERRSHLVKIKLYREV